MSDNVVEERCQGCPVLACTPSLSPSGFQCAKKLAEKHFGSLLMGNEQIIDTPLFRGLIGAVPKEMPQPLRADAIEQFFRTVQEQPGSPTPLPLATWQKKYVNQVYERMQELAEQEQSKVGRRQVQPISWRMQNRLDIMRTQNPHMAKAWDIFINMGQGSNIKITDEVISRWMLSTNSVHMAVQKEGQDKVAKLRSIYGMLYNAAKKLLDEFPTALAKDDVAGLRDVVDELEAMVHDVEQLMGTSPEEEQ